MTDSRSTPDWRPLALALATVTAVYAVTYRLMPFDMRGYFLWPFGAWALYCGARLSVRVALPLTLGIFALTDLLLYVGKNDPPNHFFYICLTASVLLGRGLLVRSESVARIVGGAVVSYAFFFLVTNFVAWLEPALPEYRPHTLDTLLLAYRKGLEFVRMQPGQIIGDLVLSLGLFGLHAVLARAYFPAEQVTPREAVV